MLASTLSKSNRKTRKYPTLSNNSKARQTRNNYRDSRCRGYFFTVSTSLSWLLSLFVTVSTNNPTNITSLRNAVANAGANPNVNAYLGCIGLYDTSNADTPANRSADLRIVPKSGAPANTVTSGTPVNEKRGARIIPLAALVPVGRVNTTGRPTKYRKWEQSYWIA